MKVLLTGATGYVGSRVVEKLEGRGHEVVAFVRSEERRAGIEARGMGAVVGWLEDPSTLIDAAREVDAVVHTAFDHAGDFFAAVDAEARALGALVPALSATGKTLVATSAAGVLGDTGATPADEDAPLPDEEAWPVAKRGRLEAQLMDVSPGLRTVVLRLPVLVYGHGASQFPPLLINKAKEMGVSYYLGKGENKLSAAHVDDIAELYALALENAPVGSLYNVAAGEPVETRELAEAVAQAAGVDRVGNTDQEKAGDLWNPFVALLLSMNFWLSAEKAKRELGWRPQEMSLLEDLKHSSYEGVKEEAQK